MNSPPRWSGKIEKIELPKPGQWIRQGQKVISFFRDGQKTEMVSPTEGEVMAINSDVLENPALLRQDPYGKGWLVSVHVPDEENTNRNLIPRKLSGRVDARSGGTALRDGSRRWPARWRRMADGRRMT